MVITSFDKTKNKQLSYIESAGAEIFHKAIKYLRSSICWGSEKPKLPTIELINKIFGFYANLIMLRNSLKQNQHYLHQNFWSTWIKLRFSGSILAYIAKSKIRIYFINSEDSLRVSAERLD